MAGLILRRHSTLVPRFTYYIEQLRRLPRWVRRSFRRRLALTVTGAALLLALSQAPIPAKTADIIVDNGAVDIDPEDGLCAVSEAIENAIDNLHGHVHSDCAPGNPAGADTIVLPPGGDFLLQGERGYVYFNSLGLPMIGSEVTIIGNGATIRQDPTSNHGLNLLTVSPQGRLTVNNVIFVGGQSRGNGGAIHALGPLIVRDSVFLNNTGSAIRADFTSLIVERSEFTDNSGDFGGGILAFHTDLTLNDSTISGSKAAWGSAVYIRQGAAVIDGAHFENNVATATKYGGALFLGNSPTATVSHSHFTQNVAGIPDSYGFRDSAGGAITVINNQFNIKSHVEISHSVLQGNAATSGGGIFVMGGEVTVQSTTISDNRAVYGGGIRVQEGRLRLDNCTISGNEAFLFVPPDSPSYGGLGGGLWVGPIDELFINNTTIAGNRAATTGGGVWSADWIGTFVVERALITGNTAPQGPQMRAYSRADGGYNLFGANGDAGIHGFTPGPSDIVPASGVTAAQIIDPALAGNLGRTPTHALPPGSPAIDAAPSTPCGGKSDQRGFARNSDGDGVPSDKECDIGAYERGPELDRQAFLPFTQR